MSFANTSERKSFFSNTKKVEYLRLTQGIHTVRILDSTAKRFDTHWLNGITILCPGEGCPICENNKRLMVTYSEGKKFREQPGWNPSKSTFLVNVLDRTLVKICPQCQTEVKKNGNTFPTTCPSCNVFLTNVKEAPANKVKVLSGGVTVFDILNAIEASNLDVEKNPIPLTSYDINIMVTGMGRNKATIPTALINQNDVVEIGEEELFDLDKVIFALSPTEMLEMQRGVSLRDILTARRTEKDDLEEKKANISADVQSKINELFSN